MDNRNLKYVVITPVRDEEVHIPSTLDSMIQQTVLPVQWIIVDDGSTDGTGKILDEYASRHKWITVIHRKDRGFRKSGGGVVDAFNDGYGAITFQDWDFIVKFDGDLSFQPDYFELCFSEFDADAQLGIGGGRICYVTNGVKTFESAPAFHVRGATKIYRRNCWLQLGGLLPAAGWDTLDEVKANSLGWHTRTFPDLHLVHHRDTGAADGLWSTMVKYGRANYICGYHPLFMVTKCASRLFKKPYVVGAVGIMYGFVTGYLQRLPQISDTQTIRYLRQQQINRLLHRQTIWK